MDDLYRDYILDHYKHPRNFGELEPHDLESHDHNPLCGDELGVHIVVEDGKIDDLRFHGQGCAISQAAASIASEELIGMPVDEVGELDADWVIEQLGIADLGHAPQVRAAVTEGHARRDDRRRELARVAGSPPQIWRRTARSRARSVATLGACTPQTHTSSARPPSPTPSPSVCSPSSTASGRSPLPR